MVRIGKTILTHFPNLLAACIFMPVMLFSHMQEASAQQKPLPVEAATQQDTVRREAAIPQKPLSQKGTTQKKPIQQEAAIPQKPVSREEASHQDSISREAALPQKPLGQKETTKKKPLQQEAVIPQKAPGQKPSAQKKPVQQEAAMQQKPAGQEEAAPQKTVRRKVDILHSDEWEYGQQADRSRIRLKGSVRLKHNDLFMNCDSAWYYNETDLVYAFSNIHIWQGDTIHIWGRRLVYDGVSGKAVMNDSVELADKEIRLFTKKIDYDVNTQVATYDDGGRILNGENTLTSIVGIYYSDQKMVHFRDSVKIVNDDYVMHADTMRYDTHNEIAWFAGPTEAVGDSIYLYCENGWSDTRNDVSQLMKNAVLDNREQRITGDTLWYDNKTGEGEGFGHVTIEDTTDNVITGGAYAWYFKRPEKFLLTGSPWFTLFSDDDTTTLRADTLRAIPQADTAGVSHRLLKAYYGCTIFSREMQGRCDSLSYSFTDSVIRLYDDPIVWSRENQLTADSIALFTHDSKADHMELFNSAFVVSSVDSTRFDQISGKNLSGYFVDNKLHRIEVSGNGEAIYYVVDGNELVGVNRARSATIEIIIEDGKIREIYQKQSPDGTLDPPLKTPDSEMRLDGFRWHPELRPTRNAEIKIPGQATEKPDFDQKQPMPDVDLNQPVPDVGLKQPMPDVGQKQPMPDFDQKHL